MLTRYEFTKHISSLGVQAVGWLSPMVHGDLASHQTNRDNEFGQ